MSYDRLDPTGLLYYTQQLKARLLNPTVGAYEIEVTIDVDSLVGRSIVIKKNDVVVETKTVPASKMVTFIVGESGIYEISATTEAGTIYKTNVTIQPTATAELKGFDWHDWLATANISSSGYSSLDDVLEDEVAIRKLMTIHASVDYLVDSLA